MVINFCFSDCLIKLKKNTWFLHLFYLIYKFIKFVNNWLNWHYYRIDVCLPLHMCMAFCTRFYFACLIYYVPLIIKKMYLIVLHIFFWNKVPLIQGLFIRFWTDTLHSTVHQSRPFGHTALFKYPRTQLVQNLAVVQFKTYLIGLPLQKVVTWSRYLAIMINSQYLSKYAIIKYFSILLHFGSHNNLTSCCFRSKISCWNFLQNLWLLACLREFYYLQLIYRGKLKARYG